MASSHERLLIWIRPLSLGALIAASGCSVGVGQGTVQGTVSAPGCNLSEAPLSLRPTFFSAEAIDDPADPHGSFLTIRIQHGSDGELISDGIDILVPDSAEVQQSQLDQALQVGVTGQDVGMNLFLNDTCPAGLDKQAVNYLGVSGTITFRSIYAPSVNTSSVEIAGSFTNVHLVDRTRPSDRWATIDGSFRFLFNRGQPAQRFP